MYVCGSESGCYLWVCVLACVYCYFSISCASVYTGVCMIVCVCVYLCFWTVFFGGCLCVLLNLVFISWWNKWKKWRRKRLKWESVWMKMRRMNIKERYTIFFSSLRTCKCVFASIVNSCMCIESVFLSMWIDCIVVCSACLYMNLTSIECCCVKLWSNVAWKVVWWVEDGLWCGEEGLMGRWATEPDKGQVRRQIGGVTKGRSWGSSRRGYQESWSHVAQKSKQRK